MAFSIPGRDEWKSLVQLKPRVLFADKIALKVLERADCVSAVSGCQFTNQVQVERLQGGFYCALRVRNVLRTAREQLHGDEVFETYELQGLSVQRDFDGSRKCLGIKPAYAYQQINLFVEAIL